MTTATVTPKYVNQPKAGKKFGSIKDQAGVFWLVEPGLLGSFSPGTATIVEWKAEKFQDGTDVKKITGIVHGANGATPTPAAHSNQGREIFITGVVGRAMGSGKFAIGDIPGLTGQAAASWDAMMENKKVPAPRPQAETGLDDSVPF